MVKAFRAAFLCRLGASRSVRARLLRGLGRSAAGAQEAHQVADHDRNFLAGLLLAVFRGSCATEGFADDDAAGVEMA